MTHIVLCCTITNAKTKTSFYFLFVYQNLSLYCFEVAPKTKCVRETLRLMFLSRRRHLVRRLWKLGVRCDAAEELVRRLQDQQLEMLLAAVESRGADLSACVLLPRDSQPSPHVLACRAWRWHDLYHSEQVRRLPGCRSAQDSVYICCNPYHWSRLYEPESPPPPYCRFALEKLKPEDRAPSEADCDPLRGEQVAVSFTTAGEENGREWCKLAYWELGSRVGRQFAVVSDSVNVFTCLPHGDGLCLATLAHSAPHPVPDPVRRTRLKIGLGVTLSQEVDGVWVYNRSDHPIFVNSPTLDDPAARSLLVYRVPSGYCLNIFQHNPNTPCVRVPLVCSPSGPIDPHSVRISFGKGWGPKYARQDVTCCPCWLEVLLKHPCR